MPLSREDISGLYGQEARELLVFFARRVFDPETAVDLLADTFASAFEDPTSSAAARTARRWAGCTASRGTD